MQYAILLSQIAINSAKPAPQPAGGPGPLAALLVLAAWFALFAGGGWRGSLRLDAGDPAQIVVDLPAAAGAWQEDDDAAWEGVLQAGGIQVRLRLTPISNCD